MAIEGTDWWAIAGAAAGGLVVGAVGAKLVSPKETVARNGVVKSSEPVFMGIRRWYEVPSALDIRHRALATIWQKGDRYWLRVYSLKMPTGTYLRDEVHFFNLISQGVPYDVEEGNLESMEEAMEKAHRAMESLEMDPITDWGYPSEQITLKV